MLRALCLAMAFFLSSPGPVSADAVPGKGGNAALSYWQAFAQLPVLTDAEQKKLYAECVTMPLDAHVRDLLTRFKTAYAFRMMYRGATRKHCEWDIAHEEGISALGPHAQAARVLTSLACLRARLRFDEGKNTEAIDDLVAALTFSRHLCQDGVLVWLLVSYGVEQHLIETLALHLPRLDARTVKTLKARLGALPAGGRPAISMSHEEPFCVDWLIRKVKDAKDRESLLNNLGALSSRKGDSPEKARERGRELLRQCGGTTEGMLKHLEDMRKSYRRMAEKLELPLDQFAKAYEGEEQKEAGNPMFRLLFPALPRVRVPQLRADLRRALLSAAIAVQLEGKDALKKHRDPVVGEPFEYVAFKGGFELRSKWKLDEKLRSQWKLGKRFAEPVVLTVGRRGN